MRRTRNDRRQLRHHLATIADTERKGVATLKESGELLAHLGIEKNRLRPALAGAEHVAVRESAAGNETLKIGQHMTSGE